MGTRISVLVDHKVKDYRNRPAAISLLRPAIPTALMVRDYWRTNDPESAHQPDDVWTATPEWDGVSSSDFLAFEGPGGLFLCFGERAAIIRATGRWRGFLSIDALRRVHLGAFRAVARVLGSTQLVFFPDDDFLTPAAIDDGYSQEDCMAMLRRSYGAPQLSVEHIPADVIGNTDHGVPLVWYIETLQDGV